MGQAMSSADTFPLDLACYIAVAGIVTEVVILFLTEFCGLPNPFVCWGGTKTGRDETPKVTEELN